MSVAHTLVLLSIIGFIVAQPQNLPGSNPCTGKTDCGSCIQIDVCAWCMQPDFGDRPRCFQPDLKSSSPCPEEFVFNPDNEQIMMSEAMLSRKSALGQGSSSGSMSGHGSASGGSSGHGSSSGSGSVVQISPQEVKLKLRISEFL
jgi:integrin beta 1